jgi:HlyD family secretion protein
VSWDGGPAPRAAEVSHFQAEFTPPVIYSRQERAKLVFLIEARPAPGDAVKLHPGQPVEVKFVP